MKCPSHSKNATKIDLDNLTPVQRRLQLKFLACRRHNGNCRCFITGHEPPRTPCPKTKKLSNSWVRQRANQPPVEPECKLRANRCCGVCPKED